MQIGKVFVMIYLEILNFLRVLNDLIFVFELFWKGEKIVYKVSISENKKVNDCRWINLKSLLLNKRKL